MQNPTTPKRCGSGSTDTSWPRLEISDSARQPGLAGDRAPTVRTEAPGVERPLRIERAVDDVAHDLNVGLRLHGPAYDAEGPEQTAVPEQHPGNDGVEGPLPRREAIRMSWLLANPRRPLLEHDPGARRRSARAEVVEHRSPSGSSATAPNRSHVSLTRTRPDLILRSCR